MLDSYKTKKSQIELSFGQPPAFETKRIKIEDDEEDLLFDTPVQESVREEDPIPVTKVSLSVH